MSKCACVHCRRTFTPVHAGQTCCSTDCESIRTLQRIRTLAAIMIETLDTDKDAERYDDLLTRLVGEIEALSAQERSDVA